MKKRDFVSLAFAVLVTPVSLSAWWCDGHQVLTEAAYAVLPEDMPSFFRAGGGAGSHYACDPDLFKNRSLPELTAAESPEHYFDLELLRGHPAPSRRPQFVALCDSLEVAASKVGFAPYAIAEWAGRLTLAFAEHRRWPVNEAIRAKCLVYAGILAHYAQDLCQPLHVTVDFDGRAGDDGKVPHSGIHEHVDSLIERLRLSAPAIAASAAAPVRFDDLNAAVMDELRDAHALVDSVYAHEEEIVAASGAAADFASERSASAAHFTASLFLTAWEQSESVELPGWLQR